MSSLHAYSPLQIRNSLPRCFVMLDDAQLLFGMNTVVSCLCSLWVTVSELGYTLPLQGLADEWQLYLLLWLTALQTLKRGARKTLVVEG